MGSNPTAPTNSTVYFVYILQSCSTGRFYVGHCEHLLKRFHEHATGQVSSTCNRGPWWMPYYETFPTRAEAMKRENEIKRKKSAKSIRAIIAHHLPELGVL